MNPEVTRADVLRLLVVHLGKNGYLNVSTRRGKEEKTFHIDGDNVIGRGTVSEHPVSSDTLNEIHAKVYTLDRMKSKKRVHVAYGGYSEDAVAFAKRNDIRLFTLSKKGKLSEVSPAPMRLSEWTFTDFVGLLTGLVLWVAGVVVLVVGAFWIKDHYLTIGKWIFWILIVAAVSLVLGVLQFFGIIRR